jgi:hypothetical protein
MRWNQGRTVIDKLIADAELQRVPPSRQHADQLLEYPSFTAPDVTPDSVRADLPAAIAIVETCENVLDEMSPF